jgi:hypothetical protein
MKEGYSRQRDYNDLINQIFDLMDKRDKIPIRLPKHLTEGLVRRMEIASFIGKREIRKEIKQLNHKHNQNVLIINTQIQALQELARSIDAEIEMSIPITSKRIENHEIIY